MTTKTKILVCGILPPPYFGHSTLCKILMESQFTRHFDVTFFNMKFWSYEQHKKVTPGKIFKMFRYLGEYTVLILSRRPKYILYSISFDKMPFLKDVVFCLWGRMLGRRIVLYDMGQYVRELYESSGSFYRRMMRYFLRRVTASIVLGEKTRSVYEGFMELERVFSALGSVEDSADAAIEPTEQSFTKQGVNVLYFSFLSRSKGVLTALKAIPAVLAKNPDLRFTFGGPLESFQLQKEIEDFIQQNGLQQKVSFLGYVGEEKERIRCFRGADIFIFPTLRDVFGLVLLHALSEGVPVVASREGAIPEIIIDGENGFLIEKGNSEQLAEKILLLASDKVLRHGMRLKNRKRYETHFTPEKYGERMIAAFERIERLSNEII